jgi:hypothetical protein
MTGMETTMTQVSAAEINVLLSSAPVWRSALESEALA